MFFNDQTSIDTQTMALYTNVATAAILSLTTFTRSLGSLPSTPFTRSLGSLPSTPFTRSLGSLPSNYPSALRRRFGTACQRFLRMPIFTHPVISCLALSHSREGITSERRLCLPTSPWAPFSCSQPSSAGLLLWTTSSSTHIHDLILP